MPDVGVEIICVRDETDAERVCSLSRAFKVWNYKNMPDLIPQIDRHFALQDFEQNPANILNKCNPPYGECLLARLDGEPVGILMLRRQSATEAEMNRMFVVDGARGRGIGRALATALIYRARVLGYQAIILHALNRFHAAIALYRSLGFVDDARANRHNFVDEISLRLDLN